VISFKRVQTEHRIWAAHNFPDTTADQTLQGMVEELGELASAKTSADKADAVGDVLIYAIHHASILSLDASVIGRSSVAEAKLCVNMLTPSPAQLEASALRLGVSSLGRLAHARLKAAQGIRADEDHAAAEVASLGGVIGAMELMALSLGTTAGLTLAAVWDGIVAKRDWKADNIKGTGAGVFGPSPELCATCDADLTTVGAIAYRASGDKYVCDACS